MNVTVFIPCFIDSFYPGVGLSVVKILEKLGHRVECPNSIACCGQSAFNSGYQSMISIIIGPNGTGDIERILVLGAHGPEKLTVLCW